jgi:nuclear pore complex protein Nup133
MEILKYYSAFHDELDFVSVHEALLEEFKSALSNIRGKQSLENQIDIIVKTKALSLSEKKALAKVRSFFMYQESGCS